MRLNQYIALTGIKSRRGADSLITAGKVCINQKVVKDFSYQVRPTDQVSVSGKPVTHASTVRLWLYHKPPGYITTHQDPQGRTTIFSLLQGQDPNLPRLISVGRLDMNSEGLLLLTNSGILAHHFMIPTRGWKRRYRVRVHGLLSAEQVKSLPLTCTIEGEDFTFSSIEWTHQQNTNAWLEVTLTEGKNREVRKYFAHHGFPVTRLIRTSYGPFHLGTLKRHQLKEIKVSVIKEQIGPALWKEIQQSHALN